MRKAALLGLFFGVYQIAHRSALHEYDGVMSVLPRGSRGETINISGADSLQHLFKAERRYVMALIANHQTIVRYQFLNVLILAFKQRLNNGNIHNPTQAVLTTAQLTDQLALLLSTTFFRFLRQHFVYGQKTLQSLLPLGQQSGGVDKDQCIGFTRADQIGPDHRFAEGCRRGEYTHVMGEQRIGGRHLFRPQCSIELDGDLPATIAQIGAGIGNNKLVQQLADRRQAAAGQNKIVVRFFPAVDDAGLVIDWKAHGLRLIPAFST